MPEHLRVANGIVAKDGIAEAEAANFEALKRGVLAEKARKDQEERERRVSQGLPAELTPEEKKEAMRREKEKRKREKEERKAALREGGGGRKIMGISCFWG